MDSNLAVLLVASSILVVVKAGTTPYGGSLVAVPGKSCREIYQLNPSTRGKSGYYAIQPDSKVVTVVYCDMELECGGEKGWMKIASVDADTGNCPSGWIRITSPAAACRPSSHKAGCYSTNFSTDGVPYNKVCGMMIGYQRSTTDGFAALHYPSSSINGPYLDGVSITYGTPRKHIWSYAIGNTDKTDSRPDGYHTNCPCSQFPGRSPPSFVGDHYYCESGRLQFQKGNPPPYTDDPVWDGQGCSSENSCCSNPSLPWFYRQIPIATSKNIETRICRDEVSGNEDILIKEIQLYVQ